MQVDFVATRAATAAIEKNRYSPYSPSHYITLNETGGSMGGQIAISASKEQFADWAKMILREIEPTALVADEREAV